jgi:hypothetical protein
MYRPQPSAPLAELQQRSVAQARLNATRKPQRFTFTAPYVVAQELQELSILEGRSVSNLVAHLLEYALRTLREQRRVDQHTCS